VSNLCSKGMYIFNRYGVCVPKRTTIEIDEDLLMRAKRALGCATTRATMKRPSGEPLLKQSTPRTSERLCSAATSNGSPGMLT